MDRLPNPRRFRAPQYSNPLIQQGTLRAHPCPDQVPRPVHVELAGHVPSALAACVVWALVCGAAAVASLHTAEKITREQ